MIIDFLLACGTPRDLLFSVLGGFLVLALLAIAAWIAKGYHWIRLYLWYFSANMLQKQIFKVWLQDISLLPRDKANRITELLSQHTETPDSHKHRFVGNLDEGDRRLLEDFLDKAQMARFMHALQRLSEGDRDESTQ